MAGKMKDFATSTVATAPSPADSGTSLVLQSGHGARMPATPFYATVHPPSEMPTLDNAEKVLVTTVATDTLTIVRAQGDTSAMSIEAGWRFSNTLFKEQLDDKEFVAKLNPIAVSTSTAAATAAKVATTAGGTYTPALGDIITVTFTTANTATSPTININGSGAKSILLGNINTTAVAMAGTKVMMWYDGTAFQLFGSQRVSDADTNTTYLATATFATVTGTAQTAAVNTGYITNNAAQVNVTLPTTAAVGQVVEVLGLGAGGWRVTAPSGDNIRVDGQDTGAAGYITGGQYTSIALRCIVANATWEVISYTGNITTGAGYNSAKQPLDATLTALAGLTTGSSKVPMSNGTDTFTQLDFRDEDDMSSDSATSLASQQSIKAYVDAAIATAVSATKGALFPIGAIYVSAVATNPATLLGFGTWVADSEGRSIVGKAASGTFAAAGSTMGAETHTLTVPEMPSHTHTQNSHSHTMVAFGVAASASGYPDANGFVVGPAGTDRTGGGRGTNSTTATNQNTGGGGSHNNIQPSKVFYVWRRTA